MNPAGISKLTLLKLGVSLGILVACSGSLQAANITVPNWSFESPASTFATPFIDSWQQVPMPDPANQSTLQTGVFSNQPPPDPTYIDNCNGLQAMFLFAYPQTSIFQDYASIDYANPTPTHAFNATFDVGKAYNLTVAVLGGTNLAIPMQEGTTLQLSLYYRDDANNMIPVAATTVTNSSAIFTNGTHFVDFAANLPTVRSTDSWAGRHIGIQILSTVDPSLMGGYWDLDNVRLSSTVTPVLLNPACTNGQFVLTLQSEPGTVFDILATTNLALPRSNWTQVGTVTNTFGTAVFSNSTSYFDYHFYGARQLQ